jgi:tetratricopeptide (TPR) repeat protein
MYLERYNTPDNTEIGTMYLNAARAYSDEKQVDSAIRYTEKAMKEVDVSLADLRFLGEQFKKMAADSAAENRDRYLMKYAGIVEQTQGLGEAAREYQRVYLEYPNSEYAPYCMTKHAIILEAQGELEKTREVYTKLIEMYPESNFAKNAQSMIDNDLLGKSAEEQLKILREKNKNKES